MFLSDDEIDEYHESGYLQFDSLFSGDEVQRLRQAFELDCEVPGPHRILDGRSDDIRAVYSSHTRRCEFAALIRSPRLLNPVRQLLASDVYLHQLKINCSQAFSRGSWVWHRKFPAWRRQMDHLDSPDLVSVGLFLGDVTELNGSFTALPGSHRDGRLCDDRSMTITQMTGLVSRHGMASLQGAAGSVVFLHPELVHGSGPNVSPFRRDFLTATYNDIANAPRPPGRQWPDTARPTPLMPLAEASWGSPPRRLAPRRSSTEPTGA
ncbi:phytanoyl-CoA dioxygenase family protein [Lentzea sp. NPDC051213]|uniref:phytanoyl-CoA dioxygenase family protein n=1 Tax=Lentzea sp. NPDC051213 TaxID=3364126 RepID=UPI00379AC854